MSGEFNARWEFRCGCCDDIRPKGTLAVYAADGSIVAVNCGNQGLDYLEPERRSDDPMPTDKEMAEARDKMCRSCFLVHAGECA